MMETRITLAGLKEQFSKYQEPYNLPDAPHKLDLLRAGEVMCGSPDLFRDWFNMAFGRTVNQIPRDLVDQLKTWMQSLSIVTGPTLAEWSKVGRARFADFDTRQTGIVFGATKTRTRYPSLMTEEEAARMIHAWRPSPAPEPKTSGKVVPFLHAPMVLCLPEPAVQVVALLPAVAATPVDNAQRLEQILATRFHETPTNVTRGRNAFVRGWKCAEAGISENPYDVRWYEHDMWLSGYGAFHKSLIQVPIDLTEANAPAFTGADNRTRNIAVSVNKPVITVAVHEVALPFKDHCQREAVADAMGWSEEDYTRPLYTVGKGIVAKTKPAKKHEPSTYFKLRNAIDAIECRMTLYVRMNERRGFFGQGNQDISVKSFEELLAYARHLNVDDVTLTKIMAEHARKQLGDRGESRRLAS